jgi:hypothetical protein
VVVLVADHPLAGSFAVATLEARAGRARWIGSGPGRLLVGGEASVAVLRSRMSAPGDEAPLEWEHTYRVSERSE